MIFVDTSVWCARFVPDDPNHARTAAWFAANSEPLITTDYCVDESLTLIAVRKRPQLAVAAGHELFQESIAKIWILSRAQIERAWILFQQRAAAGLSFTDCTSKIAIDDLGLPTAAALDQHFGQFGVTLVP